MKVHYTGTHGELPSRQQEKLEAKFAKLSKLLGRKGEREAHVVITTERHLNHAEITLNFYNHRLACIGSDVDQFTAICSAIDKLEKQVLKLRTKWRDTKRVKKAEARPEAEPERVQVEPEGSSYNVYRVNHHQQRKPMTLEEALLEMEKDQDYLVYRDTEKDRVSVLVRRRDGHFDLIES